MFFLLAAFMLASLSMVNLNRVKINLPTATAAASNDSKRDLVSLSVDRGGVIYYEKTPFGPAELTQKLRVLAQANSKLRVLVSGDTDARHGDVLRALETVRAAGIENAAFEIRPVKRQ
jgi:biopolymer transport protein ExbD